MTGAAEARLTQLHPHTSAPAAWITGVAVTAARPKTDQLTLAFGVAGDLDRLRLPPRQPAARGDQLWRETCFEAFLRMPGEPGYIELNLSPSTCWALYRFDSYRSGMRAIVPVRPPRIRLRWRRETLWVHARISLAGMLPSIAVPLQVAPTAVLLDQTGAASFWALSHPGERPDFHDLRGVGLALPPPSDSELPAPPTVPGRRHPVQGG